MMMRRNPEFTGLTAGLAILAVGVLLILMPLLLDMDMMQAGFAMQFGGFFLVVSGIITAAIFGYRANRLKAMFRGRRTLAHWAYDPMQLREQADRDLQGAKEKNRVLFLIVAGFFVVFTLLFVVIGSLSGEGDDMLLFAEIMAAALLIVAAFAFGMPFLQRRRALRSGGEAIVAENGLFINGVLHTWNPPLGSLDGVALVEDGTQTRLVFSLRTLAQTSATAYEAYNVEVPVPPGEVATARQVAQHFQERNLPA